MTAAEARKKQWESLKGQPLSARLKYIFTYYWPGILIGVGVLALFVSWIYGIVTAKDLALSGYLIDTVAVQDYSGNLKDDFMSQHQIDDREYEFRLSTTSSNTYESWEAYRLHVAAGEVDFIVGEQSVFQYETVFLQDLRQVLTSEQLEMWKDMIVYVEKDARDALHNEDFPEVPKYYTSTDGMTDPVPIALRLPDTCKLRQAYLFPEGDVLFGITMQSSNPDNAVAFFSYILS